LGYAVRAYGDVPLSDLERMSGELASWIAASSEGSRYGIVRALRQALEAAVRWGKMKRNRATLAGPNRQPAPRTVRAFTPSERADRSGTASGRATASRWCGHSAALGLSPTATATGSAGEGKPPTACSPRRKRPRGCSISSRSTTSTRNASSRRPRSAADAESRFRELVHEWLLYLEREKGAKPSTLIDYGWMVAEPGQPHRRGQGRSPGLLIAALGDRPISELTTREIGTFLRALDECGCRARTVNRDRQLICAAFNYAMRDDTYAITHNPAASTTKRREPPPAVLDFYEADEVENLARAAELGAHRTTRPDRIGEHELAARRHEDSQDADLYRIAAYTGLRLGELLALRWEDVNLDLRRLVVHRALSAGIEGPTKGWRARFVPLSDGAAAAFARLRDRGEFARATDHVFCNRLGRPLNGAVLRRRFKRTASAAGLRVLRFHALRHGAGSLVARQADARWVQGFLGHSKITTTERYLHAKARPEDVDRLNRAFAVAPLNSTDRVSA
jgi:integrase